MKKLALLGVLALGGCGSIHNLATGPQVFGGVRHDLWAFENVCKGQALALDIPFSFPIDVALLPLTSLFETVRVLTGWPPPRHP